MAFEEIEVINPRNPSKPLIVVPDDGVLVRPGQITIAATRTVSRFIRVKIGAKLARGISLTAEQHNLRMAFGTDADAGISFSPGGAHPPRFIFNASPEMLAVEE